MVRSPCSSVRYCRVWPVGEKARPSRRNVERATLRHHDPERKRADARIQKRSFADKCVPKPELRHEEKTSVLIYRTRVATPNDPKLSDSRSRSMQRMVRRCGLYGRHRNRSESQPIHRRQPFRIEWGIECWRVPRRLNSRLPMEVRYRARDKTEDKR